MKGTAQAYGPPTWGTKGIPSAANTPPGITQCVSWTDLQGRFWLFGGYDPSGTYPTIGLRDALWMFDPMTNEWTWMKGTNQWDIPGVYGTMGVADTANRPGARRLSFGWVDGNGDLWLFGGDGLDVTGFSNTFNAWGALNDLWRYNIASNTWTWMGGTQYRNASSSYGTIGVASSTNWPSGRQFGNSWCDAQGNFWLFGGYEYFTTSRKNETWKYDVSTNMWTWMNGGPNHPLNGNPGIQGAGAPTNLPPARYASAGWRDAQGNFWMYGGQVDSSTSPFSSYIEMDDLWKYETALNQWTWIDGSILTDDSSVFLPPCQVNTGTYPGGLAYMSESWVDACGNFWMYGGAAAQTNASCNNLWCYQPTINKWYFVSGDQLGGLPYFGIMGVANPLNDPDDRSDGSAWVDNNGVFWIFGGSANAVFNDLWKFTPDYCCNSEFSTCCAKTISVEESSGQLAQPAYPNPAYIELHVPVSDDAERIILFDMNGRIVLEDKNPLVIESVYHLSLTGIASGTYILTVEGSQTCTDQQIIIQPLD